MTGMHTLGACGVITLPVIRARTIWLTPTGQQRRPTIRTPVRYRFTRFPQQSVRVTSRFDTVILPLRSYRKLMNPPTERWPVFPTFDQRTLGTRVRDELADRGERSEAITERREAYARDLLLALDVDIRPPSITADGARSILQRLSEAAEIDIDHPKHDYLAPHGGRRGMGEVLVRAFGYTVAARYLDNSEEMVRERYSHIEAGQLGDVATEALNEVDSLNP